MPSVEAMSNGVQIRSDYVGFSLEWLSAVQVFRKPGTKTDANPNVARVWKGYKGPQGRYTRKSNRFWINIRTRTH